MKRRKFIKSTIALTALTTVSGAKFLFLRQNINTVKGISNFPDYNPVKKTVIAGVGSGGCNAVNYMFDKKFKNVDFIVANTDIQSLKKSPVKKKIQLGKKLTKGYGAENNPLKGKGAAIENMEDIKKILRGSTKMAFITAGMGGGTGTGAAPVIAETVKNMGIFTIGVMTTPFIFEGKKRIINAAKGIDEMKKYSDAVLIINSEKIRNIYGNLRISEAFKKSDEIIAVAVKGIADFDFEDIRNFVKENSVINMGTATASGENRAKIAVKLALNSFLSDNVNINNANTLLVNIITDKKKAIYNEIAYITEYLTRSGDNIDLIWKTGKDEELGDKITVNIFAI